MLKLLVRSITLEAEGIRSFELVDRDGRDLPPFEAGAHIDVRLPGGLTRQYSLCDPPWLRRHYRIAVLEVPNGRGGSRTISSVVRTGDMLEVSEPVNRFALGSGTHHRVLLAGGIGITPILLMAEQLERAGASYELHYCTKTRDHTAFLERLMPFLAAGRARLYHDGGDPRHGLDIEALLRRRRGGAHLYYCGPPGFMNATRNASSDWPRDTIHFEYFVSDAAPQALVEPVGEFEVLLDRSQIAVCVPESKSILQAVREAGVECESSCETGVCGSCRVRYLDGIPKHNDYVLSDEERQSFVLICCARAVTKNLVLDL